MKKNFIGIFVSLVFIGVLAYLMRGSLPEIINAIKNGDRALIALATLLSLAGALIMGVRLRLIFKAKDIRIRLKETISLTFVGYFFNY